jgi:hypothetical protein
MSWENDLPAPVDAVKALRARGVNNAEGMLEHATPAQILAACRRWDAEQGVTAGLLVHWIRAGEFEAPSPPTARSKAAQLRERFGEYARRFPEGAVVEPHRRLLERRWPDDVERAVELGDDLCDGDLVVVSASYPVLEMECSACGFAAGIGPRHLHVLPSQSTLPNQPTEVN